MAKELVSEDMKENPLAEDAYLIENALSDPTAFTRLYLLYIRPIYRYIFSKTGDTREAEDLTAQVFLEALESLPRYHHDGHFAAWLFSIARYKVIDHFRSQRPVIPIEAIPETKNDGDPLSSIIHTDEARRTIELINTLDEKEQELLRLRFVAELKYEEIARIIHSNTEATKKRVYRLLARMRRQLEQNHD